MVKKTKAHPRMDLITRATRILAAAGYELHDVLDPTLRPKIWGLDWISHNTIVAVEEYLHAQGVFGELPPKKVAVALSHMGLTEAQQRQFHTIGGVEWLKKHLTVHDLREEGKDGTE